MSGSEDDIVDLVEVADEHELIKEEKKKAAGNGAPAPAAPAVSPRHAAAAAAAARVSDGHTLSSFREEWKAELGKTKKVVPPGMHSYSYNPKPRPSNLATMGRAKQRMYSSEAPSESADAYTDVPIVMGDGAVPPDDADLLIGNGGGGGVKSVEKPVGLDDGHGELDQETLRLLSASDTKVFEGVGHTTGTLEESGRSSGGDGDGDGDGDGGGGGAAAAAAAAARGGDGGEKDGKEPSRKKMSKNVAEALRMFNAAIGMESTGRINEALEMYIMASKLDPNIERIAYEMGNKAAAKGRSDSSGATDASESGGGGDGGNGSDGGDGGRGGDGSSSGSSANVNLAELRGPASQFPIEPEVPTTCGHIKDLPHELLVVIMVPGCLPSLDIRQVYITRYAYSRKGEQTIGEFYRPLHLVEYYRFLRFFPNGGVVAVTSAELPQSVVPRLKHPGQLTKKEMVGLTLYTGQYTFDGERVVVTVGQRIDTKTVATFTTQLLVAKRKGVQSMKLVWERHYGGTKREGQLPMMNDYDLTGFLPYTFSPVRRMPIESFDENVVFAKY